MLKIPRPNIECSKCQSKNTELKRGSHLLKKEETFLSKVGNLLGTMSNATDCGFLRGQYTVICKDCGHRDVIFFN